jgi:hypothetical protein
MLNQRSNFLLAHLRFQMCALIAMFALGFGLIAYGALHHPDGSQFPILVSCGLDCMQTSISFSQSLMESVNTIRLEDV